MAQNKEVLWWNRAPKSMTSVIEKAARGTTPGILGFTSASDAIIIIESYNSLRN